MELNRLLRGSSALPTGVTKISEAVLAMDYLPFMGKEFDIADVSSSSVPTEDAKAGLEAISREFIADLRFMIDIV